ncbi:colanic acid biosynthesis protein [compost metagenome]
MHRIVVSGYYGFGNLGDEAILATIVQQLGARCELVVLSANPEQTEAAFGVRAIPRLDLKAIARELRGASLFLSGGGGLMQDVTGPVSVPYYGGLMTIARVLGVPNMVFGQGVGPLGQSLSRMLTRFAFSSAKALTVRDQASYALLRELGIRSERLKLTADPVLCLEGAPPERIDAIASSIGIEPGRPTIAVALRPWHTWYERQFKILTSALTQIAVEADAQVVLLPFQLPGDERITEELRACLEYRPEGRHPRVAQLKTPLSPAEMMGLIGRMDLVVGMRLHALIMAAASGVPALGLVYDPKVAHLCSQWNFPAVPSLSDLDDARSFEDLLRSAWNAREASAALMVGVGEAWRAKARMNFEVIESLLGLAPATSPVDVPTTGV